jgi:hypothetical protein
MCVIMNNLNSAVLATGEATIGWRVSLGVAFHVEGPLTAARGSRYDIARTRFGVL